MSEFNNAFHTLARKWRIPAAYAYPSQLTKDWTKRVNDLNHSGYSDDVVEYDNDVSIRGYIEKMLHRAELSGFDEYRDFQQEIERLDNMLKQLFIPNVHRFQSDQWWSAGILMNGRGEYAWYIKQVYGITLEGYTDNCEEYL